jgi:uncharacterized protein YrrD
MTVLRSLNDIRGYVLKAQDGEIGKCSDFLFDDRKWTVRYVVADTMKWLPGRKVLISPIAIGDANGLNRRLEVNLSKKQIKDSPPLDTDAPVSRQFEIAFNNYYDWAHYWHGTSAWGPHLHPRLLYQAERDRSVPDVNSDDPHLRSTREVSGYHIQATDTGIGHVEDFIVDSDTWIIRYLVIDTRNWLPASKKVLVAQSWVDRVDWKRRKMLVDLASDQVRNSPEYDPSLPVNREYEIRMYDFYGRPQYW